MSTVAVPSPWKLTTQGMVLHVYVQPRASQNRLIGRHGDSLKIALTAPPVENAANAALLAFLGSLLQTPRSSLTLVAGAKSRKKRVQIATQNPAAISQRLAQLLTAVDKKISDG